MGPCYPPGSPPACLLTPILRLPFCATVVPFSFPAHHRPFAHAAPSFRKSPPSRALVTSYSPFRSRGSAIAASGKPAWCSCARPERPVPGAWPLPRPLRPSHGTWHGRGFLLGYPSRRPQALWARAALDLANGRALSARAPGELGSPCCMRGVNHCTSGSRRHSLGGRGARPVLAEQIQLGLSRRARA